MSTIYKLKNVSKIYKKNNFETRALDNLDLEIEEGELIVVLGPSGSGKSTLLNVMSSIDFVTNGEIYYKDTNICALKEQERINFVRSVPGFVFQSYNLIPNLTVKENIELSAHVSKNPMNINEIIKLVGLNEHKHKFPYQLSGGMMQRVSIARALVRNPKVLFCDEPTGALDEKMGKRILSLIQKVNKKYKTTVIVVTHNPSIGDIANTVLKMKSGQIVEIHKNKKTKKASEIGWA